MRTKSQYNFVVFTDGTIRAGELDKWVTLQRKTVTKNTYGEEDPIIWRNIARFWAAIKPLRGKIITESLQDKTEITSKIIIRFRNGVRPSDQVIYKNTVYEIDSIINTNNASIVLELLCREWLV